MKTWRVGVVSVVWVVIVVRRRQCTQLTWRRQLSQQDSQSVSQWARVSVVLRRWVIDVWPASLVLLQNERARRLINMQTAEAAARTDCCMEPSWWTDRQTDSGRSIHSAPCSSRSSRSHTATHCTSLCTRQPIAQAYNWYSSRPSLLLALTTCVRH